MWVSFPSHFMLLSFHQSWANCTIAGPTQGVENHHFRSHRPHLLLFPSSASRRRRQPVTTLNAANAGQAKHDLTLRVSELARRPWKPQPRCSIDSPHSLLSFLGLDIKSQSPNQKRIMNQAIKSSRSSSTGLSYRKVSTPLGFHSGQSLLPAPSLPPLPESHSTLSHERKSPFSLNR